MDSLIEIDHQILETHNGIIITSNCRFKGQEKINIGLSKIESLKRYII